MENRRLRRKHYGIELIDYLPIIILYILGFLLQVKAWMTNKEAEALRNQQELVKEEEAALMKKWVLETLNSAS